MKNQIKYIVNAQSNVRIPLIDSALSANKIAELPQVKGKVGKTGILELLRGQKSNVKGFEIVEAPAPDRANKCGVEYCGTGKLRKRKPMQIYVSPCKGRGLSDRLHGDFAKYLTAVYHVAHKQGGKAEYNDIREALPGWSRDIVAIYSARAKKLGYITTTRESGKL